MSKVMDTLEAIVSAIKAQAIHREDGNTEALLSKVERDLKSLLPEYREMTFYDLAIIPSEDDAVPAPVANAEAGKETEEVKTNNGSNKQEGFTGQAKSGKVAKAVS